jgi:isopentenyl-diphosphate delta-isomerase
MTVARESHLVELVDATGTAIGSATVDQAHQAPGQMHRAFSVFLRDGDGRVLLQQRAEVKTRFPLRWGNTACGHPAPGEDLAAAAQRRLAEEVGVSGVPLEVLGVYPYYAEDPASGRVEYEYDHVLVGDVPADVDLAPDPAEVADLRWVPVETLTSALAGDTRTYVPWLSGVLAVLTSAGPSSPAPSSPAPSSASPAPSATAGPSATAAPLPSSTSPAVRFSVRAAERGDDG